MKQRKAEVSAVSNVARKDVTTRVGRVINIDEWLFSESFRAGSSSSSCSVSDEIAVSSMVVFPGRPGIRR